MVRDLVMAALPGWVIASAAEQADLRVGLGLATTLARWVYAVVTPFPMMVDGVKWEEVRRFWAGEAGALTTISGDKTAPTLFVTRETMDVLQRLLGTPGKSAAITVLNPAELVPKAWAARPHAWAIVPFDELAPRWKVLLLDGANVLDKALDLKAYPLTATVGAEGKGVDALTAALAPKGKLATNRDTDQMTTLVMTGVTALVRASAAKMEEKGILYPAEKVGAVLKAADIAHISNEIPFATNCPPPDPKQESLVFCSSPAYMELLRAVGTDVIELTGNHFQDYGSEATLATLEMYRKEGWPYYGGGANLEDAQKPLVMTNHGNQLSFIGCNPVGPEYAWATRDRPGAAPCDFDYMHGEVARLKLQGVLPIVTWQYWEFYFYEATPQQQLDFRGMVDAGAAIVSGSQAHHPQAIEFYKDGFIHYGLGNLFFDQMRTLGTRQEIIDRHTIYKGRHISTELLTYMLEDYCQPRPMTPEERTELLKAVFKASGW
jgi:poly-gamma-glutamate synthesis protein (capsule biosynthesis protein)